MGDMSSATNAERDSSQSTSNTTPPALNMSAKSLVPAPSEEEVDQAISSVKELFESPAHSTFSETEFSSKMIYADIMTSESEQLEMIKRPSVQSKSAIDVCCSLDTSCAVMKNMIVGAAMDKNVWDSFLNCEPVEQFRNDLLKIIVKEDPLLSILDESIHTNGNQGSKLAKDGSVKLILEKTKELVLQTVNKAFDSMEKLFLPCTQSQQKHAFKDASVSEGASTREKIFSAVDHIMRTPFLTTLLINTVVFACRVVKIILK